MEVSRPRAVPAGHHSHRLLARSAVSLLGIALLALGIACLQFAAIGVDPFTALNWGAAERLHVDFGTYQLLCNLAVFAVVLALDRRLIGLGTIFNMVLVGYAMEFFLGALRQVFPATLPASVAGTVAGLLLLTLGTSLYTHPKLGAAPYDAIAPIVAARLGVSYKAARWTQDALVLALALLVAGPVWIGTLLDALVAGPLIAFWTGRLQRFMPFGGGEA